MNRNHDLRIKKIYFDQINKGIKTLEVRVGYHQIRKIQAGDTVTFSNYSQQKFDVVRVTRYCDFPEMLDTEDSQRIIPGVTKYKALDMLQAIYPEDKERLGVYVIELRKQKQKETKVLKVSDYLNSDHKKFSELVSRAYDVTDYICKDYPKHFSWYWEKTVPELFKGTREILVAIKGGDIAGVAFLKKEDDEKKICTFLVLEKYRSNGVATKLLEEAFKFLGTEKPLITIADYKLDMFAGIIQKYGWEQTEIMGEGFYNDNSREVVYNGKLS